MKNLTLWCFDQKYSKIGEHQSFKGLNLDQKVLN